MYAIVDIETTGGSSKKHGITEIAIIRMENDLEVDRFQTLINPGHTIPPAIVNLTGITNEMVKDAPRFEEVASEIFERLTGVVFVAHNVGFDYGFIRAHLAASGFKWSPKRLCTVRLSRKIFPGMYSYSLGKLAQQLGFKIEGRHRAMGDCEFTAQLFKLLLEKDKGDHVKFALNARSTEATLPPHLPRSAVEHMPNTLGVYLFFDSSSKVIYVGKANKIKQRVRDHFRGNTHTGYKSRFAEKIANVKWIECPNELVALLTEAQEIKKHWPPYNRLMKRVTLNWGLFHFEDQNGYGRLNIGRVGKWARPIISFRSQFEARQALMKLRDEYTLCARFCGLQDQGAECANDVHGPCQQACIGVESSEEYNLRLNDAIRSLTIHGTMIIRDNGFTPDEQTVVLIEKGRYKGHGIVPKAAKLSTADDVLNYIETGYDDQDIQSIIRSQLHRNNNLMLTTIK